MLATPVSKPFDRPGWVYEEKYDGYRILAYKGDPKINAVTPEQVSAVAKKYLAPDQMKIVVVGDKEKIAEQVRPYEATSAKQ